MEGRRRSAEGVRPGEGRRSQYGGLGALPPENSEM